LEKQISSAKVHTAMRSVFSTTGTIWSSSFESLAATRGMMMRSWIWLMSRLSVHAPSMVSATISALPMVDSTLSGTPKSSTA
jgi:hypothetical protein